MIAYLGGRCARCGTTENLHFDHVDPEQKSFEIKANMTLNNPKVKAELDKCQLLCGPHHREKTALEQSGWTHGTTYAWMKKGCRCEICEPIWRAWHDARNEKRRKGVRGPYRPRPGTPIRQSD
jgi:hypothetical protein